MSNVIIKRLIIAIVCVLVIPASFYLLLKGFHGARYYQRYVEAPKLAWNQMRTIELAGLPSNAVTESNLNSKVIDWSANGASVNWLIRLFRFGELAEQEKANKVLLCDLQQYRQKHPISEGYYEVMFKGVKANPTVDIENLQAVYVQKLNADWQKIMKLSCGVE